MPAAMPQKRLLVIQSWISYRGAEHISVEIAHLCKAEHGWDVKLLAAFVDQERLPPQGQNITYVTPPKIIQALLNRSPTAYLLLAPALLTCMATPQASKRGGRN